MRKATRTQWIKFSIVTLLYLAFLVWVKSWLGLIVLPFIFDIYDTVRGRLDAFQHIDLHLA